MASLTLIIMMVDLANLMDYGRLVALEISGSFHV